MARRRNLQRAANPAPKPKPEEPAAAEAETPVNEAEAEAVPEEGDGVDHGGEEQAPAEPTADPEPEPEPVTEPEAATEPSLIYFGSMVGELGFRMPIYHTAAVDRLIRDCPPNDAVSSRERDILRAAYAAIQDVSGNPDSLGFEAFLTTHEGADNFPLTFTVTPRTRNGEVSWAGIIDTNEIPVEQH